FIGEYKRIHTKRRIGWIYPEHYASNTTINRKHKTQTATTGYQDTGWRRHNGRSKGRGNCLASSQGKYRPRYQNHRKFQGVMTCFITTLICLIICESLTSEGEV